MNFRLSFLVLLALLGLRCVNSEILPVDYPEPKVTSSLFVSVFDTQGEPIEDAIVGIQDEVFVTDEFGISLVNSIEISERVYVTVEKLGYFKGSRRLYAAQGQTHYLEIILMERKEAGTISSAQGGEIVIDGNSSLSFPADAIVTAEGTAFNGTVHVSGYTIYADDPDLSAKMPGILEGENQNGELGLLTSYGMMAVELHSDAGEELQVKNGQTVKMTIEVPASMREAAPQEIDMWYFDDDAGEWQLDGTGTFNGEQYEANVSHFTIWNCDDWSQTVKLRARFVDESGLGLKYLDVCYTVANLNISACDMTNSSGEIFEYLPANEIIRVELVSECGSIMYSQQIGPLTSNTDLGVMTVSFASPVEMLSTISGVALDCDNQPLSKGHVLVKLGKMYYHATPDPADGSFSLKFNNCSLAEATIMVFDQANSKYSDPKALEFTQFIDVGTLKACEDFDAYINLTFQGFQGQFVFHEPVALHVTSQEVSIQAEEVDQEGVWIRFDVECPNPDNCSLSSFAGKVLLPNGQVVWLATMQIEITQFGPVGTLITGTVTGHLYGGGNGQGGPGFTIYTGEFAVVRS